MRPHTLRTLESDLAPESAARPSVTETVDGNAGDGKLEGGWQLDTSQGETAEVRDLKATENYRYSENRLEEDRNLEGHGTEENHGPDEDHGPEQGKRSEEPRLGDERAISARKRYHNGYSRDHDEDDIAVAAKVRQPGSYGLSRSTEPPDVIWQPDQRPNETV